MRNNERLCSVLTSLDRFLSVKDRSYWSRSVLRPEKTGLTGLGLSLSKYGAKDRTGPDFQVLEILLLHMVVQLVEHAVMRTASVYALKTRQNMPRRTRNAHEQNAHARARMR
jgi:hypothetical protein